MIRVVHAKGHIPTRKDVLTGKGTPLENPFSTKTMSKEESMNKYRDWLINKINRRDSKVIMELNKIYTRATSGGVNIVCFYNSRPCNGDVIKEIIEKYFLNKK
jgi:hypothetical protein